MPIEWPSIIPMSDDLKAALERGLVQTPDVRPLWQRVLTNSAKLGIGLLIARKTKLKPKDYVNQIVYTVLTSGDKKDVDGVLNIVSRALIHAGMNNKDRWKWLEYADSIIHSE